MDNVIRINVKDFNHQSINLSLRRLYYRFITTSGTRFYILLLYLPKYNPVFSHFKDKVPGRTPFFAGMSCLLFLIFFFIPLAELFATHLRAGQITVRRDGCTRTVRILIEVYTKNVPNGVLFGGEQDILDFGDGTAVQLVPVQQNIILPELNPDGGTSVGYAFYTIEHTYSAGGRYIISYREPNRNGDVLNMTNSIGTYFYIETELRIDPAIGCNSTPILSVPPIDRACPGQMFTHNPGAFDPNPEDVLTYRLVPNKSDRGKEVENYRDPNVSEFYTGIDYNTESKEGGGGPPEFSIDSIKGTITWNAPWNVGEYNIAFEVIENRFKNGAWIPIGFVRRDMQIIVEDCENHRPELIIPEDTCIVAKEKLEETITATDEDGHPVMIQAFGQILDNASLIFPSPASVTPDPAIFQSQPAEANFTWQTVCDHVRERPYQVVFKATDNPPGNTEANLATFKVWLITVVGPKPEFTPEVVDNTNRTVQLNWEPYDCQNASQMQIWRKVESTTYNPDCETGLPPNLGYQLINTIPIKNGTTPVTTYLDNNGGAGLSPGAQYCYRLVAVYPQPKGGESLVSEELCVDPFPITIPLLTKVSVMQTDEAAGEIQLEWIQPPDFVVQPGHVLTYNVRRGSDFTRGADVQTVATGLTQLDYLDQGLNTENFVYNYSIQLFDNGVLVDESPVASSVRLEAEAQDKKIKLTWSAVVPWSNQIAEFPKHIIKRGPGNSLDADLVTIDTVDVTNGFEYIDEGPLDQDETYCYKIETIGGYGNPAIPQLIRNFSQKLCTQPGDDIDPCPPIVLAPEGDRCEKFFAEQGCSGDEFVNTIRWNRPTEECGNDILYYWVYYSNSATGEWTRVNANIRDTVYVDRNLNSFARCYRIRAVDRTLNESELSEPICFDNCPYFELPNVFTPNGDGCNDIFSAFKPADGSENPDISCTNVLDINTRCPRFVTSVVFRVFSRWGNEVYEYNSAEATLETEDAIYINWDGRDKNNRELSNGIYYWVAEVTFNMIDPKKRHKTYKGWVHVISDDL